MDKHKWEDIMGSINGEPQVRTPHNGCCGRYDIGDAWRFVLRWFNLLVPVIEHGSELRNKRNTFKCVVEFGKLPQLRTVIGFKPT